MPAQAIWDHTQVRRLTHHVPPPRFSALYLSSSKTFTPRLEEREAKSAFQGGGPRLICRLLGCARVPSIRRPRCRRPLLRLSPPLRERTARTLARSRPPWDPASPRLLRHWPWQQARACWPHPSERPSLRVQRLTTSAGRGPQEMPAGPATAGVRTRTTGPRNHMRPCQRAADRTARRAGLVRREVWRGHGAAVGGSRASGGGAGGGGAVRGCDLRQGGRRGAHGYCCAASMLASSVAWMDSPRPCSSSRRCPPAAARAAARAGATTP